MYRPSEGSITKQEGHRSDLSALDRKSCGYRYSTTQGLE